MSPAMAEMKAYPRYLFDKVEPYLGERVWEIGVGHGTYTGWLHARGKSVLATDIDVKCVQSVKDRFRDDLRVVTAQVDLTSAESIFAQHQFQADSILCFNVMEHIQDDVSALRWLRISVAQRARCGLIVPAHPHLFGRMDSEAGHFRRYTRWSLATALRQSGWVVERVRYLNVVGAIGWWYHNRWRKQAGLADGAVNRQMRSADAWLPKFARLTDPLFGYLSGLSVMAIAHAGPLTEADKAEGRRFDCHFD